MPRSKTDPPHSTCEPPHGSAPDISGFGIANPIGTILSGAMMFEHGFGATLVARAIEGAVEGAHSDGIMPPDIGGSATTIELTNAVLSKL